MAQFKARRDLARPVDGLSGAARAARAGRWHGQSLVLKHLPATPLSKWRLFFPTVNWPRFCTGVEGLEHGRSGSLILT